MANLLLVKIQDINITASQQEGSVEPELQLCDYRRGQKDTYFTGRERLLELRKAIDFALGEPDEQS